ncbi:porin [Fodinicurvata sp. EGI_FJ10296]|uniref:porin n=1 Tax=Fodinicurvata sp. EGI_FJ10296 TaxID=3231908 RepID=UPI003456CFE4
MKKLFLATSAMAAAGLMANQAAAQIEVSLGGQLDFEAGMVIQDNFSGSIDRDDSAPGLDIDETEALDRDEITDAFEEIGLIEHDGRFANFTRPIDPNDTDIDAPDRILGFEPAQLNSERNGDFRNRMDNLTISVSNTADNGLTYGGSYNVLKGEGNDSAQLFVSGAFGTVRMGDWDAAANELGIGSPSAGTGGFDGNFGDYVPTAGIIQTGTAGAAGTNVTYLTTGTALDDTGLTLGISYTPQTDSSDWTIERDNADGFQDAASVAAKYEGEFSGVSLSASAGYEFGTSNETEDLGAFFGTRNHEDLSAYQLGANVGFGGFTFGGQWVDDGDSGLLSGGRHSTVSVGVTYAMGALTVGANYANGAQEVSYSESDDGLTASVNEEIEEQRFGLGASYSVAPGLDILADLTYYDNTWNASETQSDGIRREARDVTMSTDGWVGLVNTRLSF